MVSPKFYQDIEAAKRALGSLPCDWDGKQCVLALKEADYNWRQMEWIGFYFEHKCRSLLQPDFCIPGDRFGTVSFDAKRTFNWDFKSKAIKSDDHKAILNDKSAMEASVERYGEHGGIIALLDVEYNDSNRTFQTWHSQLKGGLSKYERERKERTAVSRYRKTRAILVEILFLHFDASALPLLDTMNQGRNSNGAPRPPKYMIDLEKADKFLVDRLKF